ncbi:MAG: MBL fold metallo-hydrolase [Planctomycetota bacterium]|jgi:glyoxylase-like metal-dependent hydrolase (beta-lactamase superfamily II)
MGAAFAVQQIHSGPCFSYLLTSGDKALLIDPHITKPDIYRNLLKQNQLTLAGIVDTHTHADHISSAAILKSEFDCPLYMSKNAVSSLDPKYVSTGDTITFGNAILEVIDSPGHTDDSIALAAEGVIFTGDVLMIGSVGRTDFQNGSPADMFDTLARFKTLDDGTIVYPAHDYKDHTQSTIQNEKTQNAFMTEIDKDAFVANMKSKVLTKPFNMDQIIRVNREGSAREVESIDAVEVKKRLDVGTWQLLDVRSVDEYKAVRITPSINIPIDTLQSQLQRLKGDTQWIISCRSGVRAARAAETLLSVGIQNICIARESLNGWLKHKYPVVKEKVPMSLERQVRTIAGTMVLVGSILAILISKWFLVIPLWVGAGLFYAGLSNSCMMGQLLRKLPYNQKAEQTKSTPGGTCAMDSGTCAVDAGTCSMDTNKTDTGKCAM